MCMLVMPPDVYSCGGVAWHVYVDVITFMRLILRFSEVIVLILSCTWALSAFLISGGYVHGTHKPPIQEKTVRLCVMDFLPI